MIQQIFTCSKSTIETPGKSVKDSLRQQHQIHQKDVVTFVLVSLI